jgi:DNA-binding beta-propeller fold protein YncE
MPHTVRVRLVQAGCIAAMMITCGASTYAQSGGNSSLPNPYHVVDNWAKLPPGRVWGQVATVDIDPKGNIWVFERCATGSCKGRTEDPILEFDPSGKLLKSFGSGMFSSPHGLTVDNDGNIWVTDAEDGPGPIGHQAFKFTPDGKVLMTLGKKGVPGTTQDTFNRPSDVAIGKNGDLFVADGHGDNSNARIVKFTKDGKFIKAWGTKGSGPGQFDLPHALAMDSKGRLFVADRNNSRIQIFDQNGKFLAEWRQFGRPSGIYIDKHDNIYVADSESNTPRNPGFKRGIYIGSAKDGKVTAFIPNPEPDPDPDHTNSSAAEGVAADASGNVYGAEVQGRAIKKYSKN